MRCGACLGLGDEGQTLDPTTFWLQGGIWTTLDPQSGEAREGAFAVQTATPRGSSLRLDRWIDAQCAAGKHVVMGAPAHDPELDIMRLDVAATETPLLEGFVPGAGRPPLQPVLCAPRHKGLTTNAMLTIGAVGLATAFAVAISSRKRSAA